MSRFWSFGDCTKGHFEIILVVKRWRFKLIVMYMKGEPYYELYDILNIHIGRVFGA